MSKNAKQEIIQKNGKSPRNNSILELGIFERRLKSVSLKAKRITENDSPPIIIEKAKTVQKKIFLKINCLRDLCGIFSNWIFSNNF